MGFKYDETTKGIDKKYVVSNPTGFTFDSQTPASQKVEETASVPSTGGFIAPDNAITQYGQRVADQYSQIGSEITSSIQKGAQDLQAGNPTSLLRTGLRTAGGVARAALAPIMEAPGIKQATEAVAKGISSIPGVKTIVQKGTELAQKNPEIAKDIGNIVDILTLGGGAAVAKPVLKEAGAVSKDIAQAAQVILTPSEEAVQKNVVSLFEKSIKPTAQKTTALKERYDSNILNALKTIKANSSQLNIEDATGEIITGRTPQTLNELSQGLDQTKDIVFKQYDALAKQAGTAGAQIDANPIASELDKVAQSTALQLKNPELIKYAEDWATRLRKFNKLDTETTQEVVKLFNNDLKAFYANPSYELASKLAIDAGIANNFRIALDKAIEGATGSQYQALKNQYAALKAIEKDVVRASLRDARKNTKGLLDYTDMFTGGQMLSGLLSLNPAMFTKGAIERGIKEYIKFLNDPNRAVGNMFDKLEIDTSKTFSPTSELGKLIKNSNVSSPRTVVPGTQ